ncbi:TetR/AcrR family transcriptional regulator [Dethiobacter alkaliphilus]|uniref:TetR/AcrR family transcriptional regulator n=1 Tax=Dethiobacter alkaliphilus TaxID=427926 RepID=UPI002227EC35|nr:TetR/AcrR family transcriptional regulator [Dethiobacter alkaliphilus]MCW3490448.1 TetR/AcrR family transcriptional regulator [Dethiobacter alkaliphilus]
MPKAFSDAEREQIYKRLIEAGKECWEKYGIKRTNVDDLASLAGISKGTFYLFFKSKELFFMEVMQQGHDEIKGRLMEVIMTKQGQPRERFVGAIMAMYEEIRENKWLLSLINDKSEYEYLVRKLPAEQIEQHIMGDDHDTKQLLALFGVDSKVKPEVVSAALRGMFLMLLQQKEVGAELMDDAFQLLLEGMALRIFEEEQK